MSASNSKQIVRGPITRTQLALFAGASGDHNPIHLDDEEAKKGGLPGVIAHGMLSMAFLGDLLLEFGTLDKIRQFDARFVAMAFPGDTITCRGEMTGSEDVGGEHIATVQFAAINQDGKTIADGQARVAVSK